MKPRLWLAVLAAALLGALAGIGGYVGYERYQERQTAALRPDFQLPDLDNRLQQVGQWDGKVLVLNFWATWCPPCVEEIPVLIELQRQFGDQGLQLVGIAVDRRDDAHAFAARMGINYPLLYGVQPALEVSLQYGNDTGSLPFTVIVDRQGVIRHVFRRQVHHQELEQAIRPLL